MEFMHAFSAMVFVCTTDERAFVILPAKQNVNNSSKEIKNYRKQPTKMVTLFFDSKSWTLEERHISVDIWILKLLNKHDDRSKLLTWARTALD